MSVLLQTTLNVAINAGIAVAYWRLVGKETTDLVTAGVLGKEATLGDIVDSSRGMLLGVLEECPAGFAIFDMDGRWRIVNREVERILGRTSVELTSGPSWRDFTEPGEAEKEAERQIDALLRGEIARFTHEKTFVDSRGEPVPVRMTVFLGSLATARVFVAYIEDMRSELIQRNKEEIFRAGATERINAQQRTIGKLRRRLDERGEAKVTEGFAGLHETIEGLKAQSAADDCGGPGAAVDK